jgi:predicted ATPase
VHKRLHEHGRVPNAVQVVALQLFEQSRLLCLDEVEGKLSSQVDNH